MKTVEDIKTGSHGLRGGIEEALKTEATHFEDENRELMEKTVPFEKLTGRVRSALEDFARDRRPQESFADY
ncbi:MAG TPA: hypothetical protein VGM54_18125 [Chthoniobacter sp.]|jgi:hypothetical protein